MTTYSWKSAINGDWNTAKDWSPNGGPTYQADQFGNTYSLDSVIFDTGSNSSYIIEGTAHAENLTVSHDNVKFDKFTFNNIGFNSSFNSLIAPPNIIINGNANVTIEKTSTLNITNESSNTTSSGTLTISNATLNLEGQLTGIIDIQKGGILNVSQGTLGEYNELHETYRFGTIETGGTLNVTNGGNGGGNLADMFGTVNVDGAGSIFTGGHISTGGVINGSHNATLLSGFAENSNNTTNDGTITASKGLFTIETPTVGSGVLQIDSNATMELSNAGVAANSTNDVVFLSKAVLQLDQGIAETGFLRNFGTGDSIDLASTKVTGISTLQQAGNTMLTAYNGSSVVDTLKLSGSYSSNNLYVHNDGNGGTLIDYTPKAVNPLDAIKIS